MSNTLERRFAAGDGVELFMRAWLPLDSPRATILVLHGIFEHGGRHAFLGQGLAARGYAVYAMDLRGHGHSGGPRASIRRFQQFVDDLVCFRRSVEELIGRDADFIFGHSLGADIALTYCVDRTPPLAGLILSSPYLLPGAGLFPVLRPLAGALSMVWPRLRLVRMGCRNVSRDPAAVEAFKNDPLVYHDRFEVRIGAEALAAGRRLRRRLGEVRWPLLIFHGTGDLVADIAGSRELFARAASADRTLNIYENMLHECLSDPDRDGVLADIATWLDRRTTKGVGSMFSAKHLL